MNKPVLVLIQSNTGLWEDKTETIAERIADPAKGQVTIRYRGNPKEYIYRQERVCTLAATSVLNPATVQLRKDGRLISGVDSITKYPGYWLIKAAGKRKLFPESEVSAERDVAEEPACKSALDYFRAIAEMVSVKDDEGNAILARQYEFLSRVSDVSVLAKYLMQNTPDEQLFPSGSLIYPFGTNASQKIAVAKVFQSQVTIVQGPPGTGKTQTILNIVANALRLGQTVAIVSNNNAATKNVADKLKKNDLAFLSARLGKSANKKSFIQKQPGYPDWLNQEAKNKDELIALEQRLVSLNATLDELAQMNNDRALLITQIDKVRSEAALHNRITEPSPIPNNDRIISRLSSSDVLSLLVECEESGANDRNGVLRWIVDVFRYGFSGRKVRRQLVAAGPMHLRNLYYAKHMSELQTRLATIENALARNNFQEVQEQVRSVSWDLLRAELAKRFQDKTRRKFSDSDFWRNYGEILREYPIVLSTTHSLKTSLSPDCLYDYIIIDEASQVDVATGVLALSCAKRAVIVGDEKQLPNVTKREDSFRAKQIWATFSMTCSAWNFAENSLLSSVTNLWPQAPNILLREHYRCHPKIADFFNQQFYNNKLIIMTSDSGELDVMHTVFTVPGNHARGHINQRQIDVIIQEIIPALRQKGVTDIGIIAPYRAQVGALRKLIGDAAEVDTVHGFQGREKQAIILSTVDNEIGEFIDDPKMLNVAVSRAQQSFTVVMASGQDSFSTNFGNLVRYVRHQQQLVSTSQISSVFDLLYAEYTSARQNFLKNQGRMSNWDSENLAEAVIKDILNQPPFAGMYLDCMRHVPLTWLGFSRERLSDRERQFVDNPWSHVDLVIYDSIGKRPLVCIEVDGWAFHRPGSLQSVRDEIKNAAFQHSGLPLVRLSTTGSGERDIISGALLKAVNFNAL